MLPVGLVSDTMHVSLRRFAASVGVDGSANG